MSLTISEVTRRADEYFMKRSRVHRAATSITATLREMGIPYSIAGALAANAHGHVRTTADVDVLLTREGLLRFKERWLGRGWVEIFPGSKGMRDTETGVKIDVLFSGEYPGDGLPKPVAFPDPAVASEPDADGMSILPLKTLLELKLASGMTAPHRPRDLDDVIQLIRANELTESYAAQLDPYVREKFAELWRAAQIQEDY